MTQSTPSYSDQLLESVDVRQIYDKFPEANGGLKELFEKGPKDAFYLVKFWVSFDLINILNSTNIYDEMIWLVVGWS